MGTKERRAREKDATRSKIINAARDLFARHGVEAVSMRKIADAVEYSPTIIYSHFADKDALLDEICAEDFASLASVMADIGKISDPIERLRQIGASYVRFGLEYPNHYRLMFMTPRNKPKPAELGCGNGDPDEDSYALVRHSAADAVAQHRFAPQFNDVDLITQTLWAAVHGVVALQIIKGSDPFFDWRPLEQRVHLILEALLLGMGAKAKAPGKAAIPVKAAMPAKAVTP
jgi:AcrR family transcriptional regulator